MRRRQDGEAVLLNHGVFLDLGSVANDDVDLTALKDLLPAWRWHDHTPPGERRNRIEAADVVITNKCPLDEPLIRAAERLKLIAVAATGTDHIDLEAAREHGVMVCNARDYATAAVTQHTIALILNLLTRQPFYRDALREGAWCRARHFSLFDQTIREAAGLNLGIVGHGVLGRSVAEAAGQLGMNVLLAERRGHEPRPDHHRFERVLAHADVVSVHCPLTEETRGLFDRETIGLMKRDALLINTARGEIVVAADLAACLRDGVIGGAGIDVLDEEPPSAEHPLLAPDIPNLIVTPHNAWASRKARQALIEQLARIIKAFERDQPVNRVV